MSNFQKAINFVMSERIEGGLSLDPDDPGNWTGGEVGKGELLGTKYGISAAQYPLIDIRGLNREKAEGIYYRDYWQPAKCELMPAKLALVFFDFYVNTKPEIAIKCLQRALDVKADGIIGPITLAKARSMDPWLSVPLFCAERAYTYTGIKGFQKYGRGWLRRVMLSQQEAMSA